MQSSETDLEILAEFPASAPQRRFWYLHLLHPARVADNISVQWELHGTYSAKTLDAAFRAIIERHEILRTRFVERDGDLFQQVCARTEFRLGVIDLRNLDEADHPARLTRMAAELSARPFDLERPGHLRVTLVQTGRTRANLLIAAHHAVFDGYSIRVLGEELGRIAAALDAGREPDIAELPLQYGDYALWQDACETSAARTRSAEFWQRNLSDMAYFELPPDRPAPPASDRNGARLDIALGEEFGDRLNAAAQAYGASAFTVGAAVTAAALSRVTGAGDVSIGATYAGRGERELEDLIGVFINPIVLRFDLAGTISVSQTIARVSDTVRQALAHGEYPFDHLVRDLHPARDPQRTPLVSVMFSLQTVFLQEQSYGQFSLKSVPSQTPQVSHDLTINVIGRKSGWLMMMDYDANRFDRATIEALGLLMRATFDAAFEQPRMQVRALPYATPEPGEPVPQTAALPVPATDADLPERVRAIWSDILGVPAADCDGDFFDLGGHSLLVLRMLARIGTELGQRPDIADLLEAPTLRGFTARLAARLGVRTGGETDTGPAPVAEPDDDFDVIWFREGDADAPLILSVNQPFLYFNLAKAMQDRFGCANLHLSRLDDGGADLFDTLVEQAAARVVALAAGRPVLLLGHCVDGILAFHIAQRLADLGRPVQSLAMIDSWAPKDAAPVPGLRRLGTRTASKLRRFGIYGRQLATGGIGPQEFLSKYNIGKRALIAMGTMEPETEAERAEWDINLRLRDLVRQGDLRPYDCDALLFCTAGQPDRARFDQFDWTGYLAADVPVICLPGWHEDALMHNGTAEIAAVLQARLTRLAPPRRGPVAVPAQARDRSAG